MFDVGASELLMIVIVAVVVIGPKDLPLAMRTAGRWIGRMRKISGHFRSGLDAMVREAELEDMERKWREQNEAIMKASPSVPTIEDMQAPISSQPALPATEQTAELDTAPPEAPHVQATDAEALRPDTHTDTPADEAPRPSELHLPPQA